MIGQIIPAFQYMLVMASNQYLKQIYIKHLLEGSQDLSKMMERIPNNLNCDSLNKKYKLEREACAKLSNLVKNISINFGNDWEKVPDDLETIYYCVRDTRPLDMTVNSFLKKYFIPS